MGDVWGFVAILETIRVPYPCFELFISSHVDPDAPKNDLDIPHALRWHFFFVIGMLPPLSEIGSQTRFLLLIVPSDIPRGRPSDIHCGRLGLCFVGPPCLRRNTGAHSPSQIQSGAAEVVCSRSHYQKYRKNHKRDEQNQKKCHSTPSRALIIAFVLLSAKTVSLLFDFTFPPSLSRIHRATRCCSSTCSLQNFSITSISGSTLKPFHSRLGNLQGNPSDKS